MTPFLILFVFVLVFYWSERDYKRMKRFTEQVEKDLEREY